LPRSGQPTERRPRHAARRAGRWRGTEPVPLRPGSAWRDAADSGAGASRPV